MSEYDHEPIRGLPGDLPAGEHIIWQGAPDWRQLAKSALHIRLATVYFVVIAGVALVRGDLATGAAMVVLAGAVIGFLTLYAWGVGRTSVYTLTNKRIVLRVGVALNKCINIPLVEVETADLKVLANDAGNIVLSLKGAPRLGYVMLWPHARSLRFVRPRPMLRAIPDAARVAELLFKAAAKVQPVAQQAEASDSIAADDVRGLPA